MLSIAGLFCGRVRWLRQLPRGLGLLWVTLTRVSLDLAQVATGGFAEGRSGSLVIPTEEESPSGWLARTAVVPPRGPGDLPPFSGHAWAGMTIRLEGVGRSWVADLSRRDSSCFGMTMP